MTKHRELLSTYLADRRAHALAYAAEVAARQKEHDSAKALSEALLADAADQVGKIIQTGAGEARIEKVGTYAAFADIVHPVVSLKTQAGTWAKRTQMLYLTGFDFETRTWRAGSRTKFEAPDYAYGGVWEWAPAKVEG